MEFKELVRATRSYRRYKQTPITEETLRELVDLARLAASGSNLQPLKYALSCDVDTNAKVFPCLIWAGYLEDWPGPVEGERPMGYITVLLDKSITDYAGCDHGIASQNIVLGAMERGIGACIIKAVKRDELAPILDIPEQYEILHVIALGEPNEEVILEPVGPGGDIRYYRDADGGHHVPKRELEDIVL